jgi:transcriptional regulator with XRE-family HTH domain
MVKARPISDQMSMHNSSNSSGFEQAQKIRDLTERVAATLDGYTSKQVADGSGCSEETVRRYRHGHVPSVEFVCHLVESKLVSAEWLLTGRGCRDVDDHRRYVLREIPLSELLVELARRTSEIEKNTIDSELHGRLGDLLIATLAEIKPQGPEEQIPEAMEKSGGRSDGQMDSPP